MDNYNDYEENIGCLFFMLFAVGFMMLLFFVNYYNLYKFKKCYDNNFRYAYCENYKNY